MGAVDLSDKWDTLPEEEQAASVCLEIFQMPAIFSWIGKTVAKQTEGADIPVDLIVLLIGVLRDGGLIGSATSELILAKKTA